MRRRVVWASTIGNAIEWFDFTVFGLFAGTIGKLFFPKSDPAAGLLAAYGLLGIAYLARPIGGLIFGVWADKVGRKRALVAIVLAMAVGSGAIGVIPTYATIGVWAPVLLLCARLVQGFSAGGEFGTSTAMLVEFAPPGRRGFYASFQFVAQYLAIVIGALFAFVLYSKLAPESMDAWGWRVPFLAGVVIAPVGFYLRSAIDETPEFKAFLASRKGVPNMPLGEVLRRHPQRLLSLFLMIAGITAYVYIGSIFLTNFAASDLKLKIADAQLGILIVNLLGAALLPFAGLLGDRFGRRAVIVPGDCDLRRGLSRPRVLPRRRADQRLAVGDASRGTPVPPRQRALRRPRRRDLPGSCALDGRLDHLQFRRRHFRRPFPVHHRFARASDGEQDGAVLLSGRLPDCLAGRAGDPAEGFHAERLTFGENGALSLRAPDAAQGTLPRATPKGRPDFRLRRRFGDVGARFLAGF